MISSPYADLEVARAALNDPGLPVSELTALCFIQPSLRAEAAMHPAADQNLLRWLAGQADPVVAAAASMRLPDMGLPEPSVPLPYVAPAEERTVLRPVANPVAQPDFTAPVVEPAAEAPATASRGSGKGRRWALIGGGAAVAIGAVVAGWALVLPMLTGGPSAVVRYAPEFREEPGLTVVNVIDTLPRGQEWYTAFHWTGTELMLSVNNTPDIWEYRTQLDDYQYASERWTIWEADYAVGHRDGITCLARTDVDLGWYYASIRDYCADNGWSSLTRDSEGGWAGFNDAVEGLQADPARTVGAPVRPTQPEPPETGDTISAVDLNAKAVTWSWNPMSVWPDIAHSIQTVQSSGETVAVLLGDPAERGSIEANPTIRLATLDLKTGALKSSIETRARDTSGLEWVVDGLVIVTDDKGRFRALDAADLNQEKWTSSATRMDLNDVAVYPSVLPGGYLPTDGGYLRASDGERADFARDAGRRGVVLTPLAEDQLMRLEANYERGTLRASGFDRANNSETWVLDRLTTSASIRAVGRTLLVSDEAKVEAYDVRGDELESRWRYRCSGSCRVDFADTDRVFVVDTDEVVILSLPDKGKELGSARVAEWASIFVAPTVMYVRESGETVNELSAYDLQKSGLPMLWRSPGFFGWVSQAEGHLVIQDDSRGQLGILGGEQDDWRALEPPENP